MSAEIIKNIKNLDFPAMEFIIEIPTESALYYLFCLLFSDLVSKI